MRLCILTHSYTHSRACFQDVLVYCGHGAGERFIRRDSIEKLSHCAVALLIGCSSGRLTVNGTFEPVGMSASYLAAGGLRLSKGFKFQFAEVAPLRSIFAFTTTHCCSQAVRLLWRIFGM